MTVYRTYFFLCISVWLAACANTPSIDPLNRERFLQGEAVLACSSLPCSIRWASNRGALKTLYDEQAWDTLASKVTYISYDSSLAYFFLGRAAEELGATGAAKAYFARAQSASKQCEAGAFEACAGLNVAEESQRREKKLIALLEAEAAANPMSLVDAQAILSQLGLYTVAIDGLAGPRTSAALREFQAGQGIPQTGTLTSTTIAALRTLTLPENDASEAPVAQRKDKEPGPANTDEQNAGVAAETAETAEITIPETGSTVLTPSESPTRLDQTSSSTAQTAFNEGVTTSPALALPQAGSAVESTMKPERSRVKIEVELLSQADPFAEVLAVIKKGTWITVLIRGEEWATISHDKQTGYVYTDTLE